jgi:hypothetical protein
MIPAAIKANNMESPHSLTRDFSPGLSRETASKIVVIRWPITGIHKNKTI